MLQLAAAHEEGVQRRPGRQQTSVADRLRARLRSALVGGSSAEAAEGTCSDTSCISRSHMAAARARMPAARQHAPSQDACTG